MNTTNSAELFSVGEILVDELKSRNLTNSDFAEFLGWSEQLVADIISGETKMTHEDAEEIGAVLGTSAEFWINLQNSYLSQK